MSLVSKNSLAQAALRLDGLFFPDGQLKTRLWARLNPATGERLATNYAYNPQGQLAGIDYADDTPDVTYTYNARGQVAQITDGTGTRNMTYNLQTGAKISERNTGDNQHELRYGYDNYGRPDGYVLLDSATNQNLTAASYEVDSFGRFAVLRGDTIPASLGQSVAGTGNLHPIAHVYGRVAGSNLLSCVENNLLRTDYAYEVNRDIKTAVKNRNAATGEIYSEYTYSHDALDRRSARTQTGKAFAGDAAVTDAFSYNPRGEVTGSINNRKDAQNRDYAYDSIGNRLTATEGNNTNFKSEYVSNGQNQYTEIKTSEPSVSSAVKNQNYDADGNMLHDGSGLICVWDAENRLIEVTVNGKQIKYVYDAGGRRIKSEYYENGVLKETTRSVFDRWNIIAEKSTIAGGEESLKTYHRGLDLSGSLQGAGGVGGLRSMRVVTQNGNTAKDGKYFYAYDANGNVSECLHESGAYEHYEYDSFGKLTEGSFAGVNRIGFSTKQIEPMTGFYYYGYRFYDPNAGRWINRDPVEESGGVNLYGFVKNGLKTVDFLGLLSKDDCCNGKSGKEVVDEAGRSCCSYDIRKISLKIDALTLAGHAFLQYPGGTSGFYPTTVSPLDWFTDTLRTGEVRDDSKRKSQYQRNYNACPETVSALRNSIANTPVVPYVSYSLANAGSPNCAGWACSRLEDAGLSPPLPGNTYHLTPRQLIVSDVVQSISNYEPTIPMRYPLPHF